MDPNFDNEEQYDDNEVEDSSIEEEKKGDEVRSPVAKPQKHDYLKCPICYDDYDQEDRRALSLHCGHTLCQRCAEQLLKDTKISCPFDKKSYSYASVQAMGRNFTVQAILEAQKAEEEEYQGIKNCSKHFEQRLMLFCQTDRQLICQECLIQDHFGHKLEDSKPYLFGQKAQENYSKNQVDLQLFNAEMDSLSKKITEQGKLNLIKISNAYFRMKNALITEKHKAQSINGLELVTLD